MDIGAIGSTMGNKCLNPIMYINGHEREATLAKVIRQLPPLYNEQINIRFEQIK